jgi:outer membrane protein OmpA-like peptidoglycan-associated protein
LTGLLPAGVGALLGWTGYETVRPREPVGYVEPKRETPSWLIPALVLGGLVLAALGWLLSRPSPVREIPVAARPAAKMADLQLPGGVKVSVPEGSFNYSLHQWLAGTTDTSVPKRFVFDNLNFETGSTQLTPESVPTVESLVVILKAYPAVAVRLEGHTDNTGDAAANKKLSLDRAIVVKEIMIKGGIADGRVGTDGYGEEKPIASNDSADGRAKNRRTELIVAKR